MSDESLFAEALAIPDPAARAAYLDQACAGRPDVRREVEELLAAHAAASPLDRPPARRAPSGTSEPPPRGPQAAEGDLVGPYRLRERIGEGGMGEVWVADQTEPIRRRVALKLIKPGMDSRAVLARFEQERQALALMDHPNIARVLDAGATADGRPYFVMELVKGVPITEFCDTRRLTPRQRLELFVPVCQAIQHAHQKGIIHRDVKPSNVLVALHDDVPVPKVIDFGVAKAAGTPLTERSIYTGYGVLVGTPAYMAPEQAAFNQLDVDTRADVYALGVLLYELLAGSPQRYLVCEQRDRHFGEGSVVRLAPRGEVPAASLLVAWAGLTARGELNAAGEFVAWDEKAWEQRRQEMLQAAPGPAAGPLARVLQDPAWWLRGEIDEARRVLWEARTERHLRGKDESRGPGHPTAAEASLRLLALFDRLVAAAPTWTNYADRAEVRAWLGETPWLASFRHEPDRVAPAGREHYLALLDSLEASRRAGVWIGHGWATSWAVAVTPSLPREYYETALRWELARRAAGAGSEPVTIAMCLYRLGRAAEAQAELGLVAADNIPVQAGEIVLAGAAGTGVPSSGLAALNCAARSAAAVQSARLLPLRSLCLHQLGQADLARKYLAASRPDSPLYREAVERVGGRPPGTPP